MPANTAKIRVKPRHPLRTLLIVLLLACLLLWCGTRLLAQAALTRAETQAAALAATALHQAAETMLGSGVPYDSLMNVTYDDTGCVRLLSLNTTQANLLSTRICTLAQQQLSALDGSQIQVPFSAALGLSLPVGPMLPINVQHAGAVNAALESVFTAEGINQTRHTLMLHLICTVRLSLSSAMRTVTAQTDLVLAESIIVGSVPQTLLNGTGSLNLAP